MVAKLGIAEGTKNWKQNKENKQQGREKETGLGITTSIYANELNMPRTQGSTGKENLVFIILNTGKPLGDQDSAREETYPLMASL